MLPIEGKIGKMISKMQNQENKKVQTVIRRENFSALRKSCPLSSANPKETAAISPPKMGGKLQDQCKT